MRQREYRSLNWQTVDSKNYSVRLSTDIYCSPSIMPRPREVLIRQNVPSVEQLEWTTQLNSVHFGRCGTALRVTAQAHRSLTGHNRKMKTYPIEEALRAQRALRAAAGLGPEMFPIEAFIGMISDEIETLRSQGKTDSDMALLIKENSQIQITAEDISANYAPPQNRHGVH